MNKATNRVMRQEKRENNSILICTLALFLIGIVFVFSSSSAGLIMKGSDNVTSFMNKQILYVVLGLIAMFIVYKINLRFILDNSMNILFATIGVLILVLVLGDTVKGSKSWFRIGPFGIQPAEFAKITLILMTALALKTKNVNTPETFKKLAMYTFPILFLVVLQGDLGTVMIMSAIILAMMYLAGVDIKVLAGIAGAGVLGVIALSIISPYRMKRMLVFLNPFNDYYGFGYQIIQSLYALANGGLFGQGLGNSIHKFGFLPENHTDFIFSVVVEEVGLLGAAIIIFLFVLLIAQIFRVAFRLKDKQVSLITAGIASFIAIESLLNLSVVVSMMPVTGVTLPFISYGGSSLLSKAICIGLVLNINKSSKKTDAQKLDTEREEQFKKRQEMHSRQMDNAKAFGRKTRKNTKRFISNLSQNTMNNFAKLGSVVKESASKITSIFVKSKDSSKNKKFSSGKSKTTSSFTKTKKKSLSKSSKKTYISKTKKNNGFKNNLKSINLDEVYLKETGFSDQSEYLNEIDLGSVDIKKFND